MGFRVVGRLTILLLTVELLVQHVQARVPARLLLQVAGYQRIVGQSYWHGDYSPPVVLLTTPDTEQACANECTHRLDCTLYVHKPLTSLPAWNQPGRNCILKAAAVTEWTQQCSESTGGPCICTASQTMCADNGVSATITGIKTASACGTGQVWTGSCETCAPGKVPSTLGPWCAYCAAGFVKQPVGSPINAACVPATVACGSSSFANGTGICLKCPSAQVASHTGDACEYCTAGTVKVPAGTQANASCVSAVDVCGSSSYSNGTNVCLKCAAGKVANATGSGCQYCEAGTVKYPAGTTSNATCVQAGLVCGNGSYADGDGVCKYCNATTMPNTDHSQCYPCSDTRATNGGPGMIKLPADHNGQCVPDSATIPGYQRIVGQDYWFGDYSPPVVLTTIPDTEQACANECTHRSDCTLYTYHPLSALTGWTQPGSNCILKSAAATEWTGNCVDSMAGPCICPSSTFECLPYGPAETVTGMKGAGTNPCGTGQIWTGTCQSCPAAQVPSTAGQWCEPCPAGSVKQPAGTPADATCAPAVVACGSSSFTNGTGVCLKCPPGKVANATGSGCQYCEPGTVKYPAGINGNSTCMLVQQVCGNGSYADGSGICKYCNTTSVPGEGQTQCYPCSDVQPPNGGPGMVKFPRSNDGHCVMDPCASVPCKNGGKCTMTGLDTVNCTCTVAWTGPSCTDPASDTDVQIQYPWVEDSGVAARMDLLWRLADTSPSSVYNCTDVCANADQTYNAGGAIAPFSTKPKQYACTGVQWTDERGFVTTDTPGASGVTPGALPSTCTYYSLDTQQQENQEVRSWCLCRRKRSIVNTRWLSVGKLCKSLGKTWGRVITGANALCKGTSNSSVVTARNVFGYSTAAATAEPMCYTAAGPTKEFEYLCHKPDPSVCYDVPQFHVVSLVAYWSGQCGGSENGSVCAADCNPDFTPANGVPLSTCVNGQWQTPRPPGCVAKCLDPPPTSMLPSNATGWGNCKYTATGSKCHANCSTGYVGSPYTICQGGDNYWNYTWEPVVGACTSKDATPFMFRPQNYPDYWAIDSVGRARIDASHPLLTYEQVPLPTCPGLPENLTSPFAIRMKDSEGATKYLCREAEAQPLLSAEASGYRLFWQAELPATAHGCCWHHITNAAPCTDVNGDSYGSIAAGIDGTDQWLVCHYHLDMFAAKLGSTEDVLDFCWGTASSPAG